MITFDFSRSMSARIGAEGISEDELAKEIERTGDICRKLPKWGFRELPFAEEVAWRIVRLASETPTPRNFVQIGIGGSALGATALASALRPHGAPRYYVLDNVDPEETAEILGRCDPTETIYHVVSKGGETTETMAAFLLALEKADAKRFVVTTGASGFLREWARRTGAAVFDVPENVGGRFSVLSPVGLVPAAFLGIDVRGLLSGAVLADEICRRPEASRNPAYLLAAIPHLLDRLRGKRIHVMMPYARALRDVGDWWRQLWAESLGKSPQTGPTPVLSLGATDQHSQIQLYNQGPNDKWILFLMPERFRVDPKIPSPFPGQAATEYLQGKPLSAVMAALKQGTEEALAAAGRPNATLSVPEVSARTVGALLYAFEMSTAIAGTLYGVNPFDQPGVEAGKRAAFSRLGRAGYPPPEARASDERFVVRG